MREEVYIFFYFLFQVTWPFFAAAFVYSALVVLLRRFVADEPSFFVIPKVGLFFLLLYLLFWRELDLLKRYFRLVLTALQGGEPWSF